MGSKFLSHYERIVSAMNEFCGTGIWNEEDGFYYDLLELPDGDHVPLKVRSIEGFIPLVATSFVSSIQRERNPGFESRLRWALINRPVIAAHLVEMNADILNRPDAQILLTATSRSRLERILRYMFDEEEFLSPYGIRSVSKYHDHHPYVYSVNGQNYSVDYEPGEGKTGMFGGNSNWRGPVWMPINYLIIEALRTYGHYFGDTMTVEFPTGSGNMVTLGEAARLLSLRVASIFLPDASGRRPCHGENALYATDPHWKELLLFNEYFHGETGRGCGASHQTGWTALVSELLFQSGEE